MEKIELDISGLRFSGLSCGPRSGPLILCLHGFPQFADSFGPVLEKLGGVGYHAVAIDQRGYAFGARPRKSSAYGIESLVVDVAQFADALGATKFHLVGHDWGGVLAWKFASRFPGRLLSLNVLSTPHPDSFLRALKTDTEQRKKSSYLLLFRAPFHLAEKVIKAYDWAFLRRALVPHVSMLQVRSITSRLSEPRALTDALNWYREAGTNFDSIGDIHVPTLFVWGAKDQALGRTAAFGSGRYVKAPYRFEVLEDASHWLLDERPEEISQLLLSHFQPLEMEIRDHVVH